MYESVEFKLYTEVINYSNYVIRYILPCIINVRRDLKIHLLDEIYNLKRYLIDAQNTKGNIREKNIIEMIVTISMLDVLTPEILEFCPNSKKYMTSSIGLLTKIKNMTYLWRNDLESKETIK